MNFYTIELERETRTSIADDTAPGGWRTEITRSVQRIGGLPSRTVQAYRDTFPEIAIKIVDYDGVIQDVTRVEAHARRDERSHERARSSRREANPPSHEDTYSGVINRMMEKN